MFPFSFSVIEANARSLEGDRPKEEGGREEKKMLKGGMRRERRNEEEGHKL